MNGHPQDLSLAGQAEAIRTGELDATELLEATLGRIEERDPAVNAIVDRFANESAHMLAEAPEGPRIARALALDLERPLFSSLSNLTPRFLLGLLGCWMLAWATAWVVVRFFH